MEGRRSWVNHRLYKSSTIGFELLESSSNLNDLDPNSTLSLDLLPDDLLERILALLPISSVLRARAVCKRWSGIVRSKRFLYNFSPSNDAIKPWYFMFTYNQAPTGFTYDPAFRKWYYSLDLPIIETSNWFISCSSGLLCFMDNETRTRIFVCNPIIGDWRRLNEPPGGKYSDYSALSIRSNSSSKSYTVAMVKSNQDSVDFFQYDLSIHVYGSDSKTWITPAREILTGWRGGDESVICNGVLYFLIYCIGVVTNPSSRQSLCMYDLSSAYTIGSLVKSSIPLPCNLTCGRLMNLREKLVVVGGIGKRDRQDIIKGIGIWELHEKKWREVARMPHKFFQGFGEFDDVFASSGSGDLIFIQSYGSPALLIFDMSVKLWKWSPKCPVNKRFPLQLYTGFCFEPRLDTCP